MAHTVGSGNQTLVGVEVESRERLIEKGIFHLSFPISHFSFGHQLRPRRQVAEVKVTHRYASKSLTMHDHSASIISGGHLHLMMFTAP